MKCCYVEREGRWELLERIESSWIMVNYSEASLIIDEIYLVTFKRS
jgi:hypothetical protein